MRTKHASNVVRRHSTPAAMMPQYSRIQKLPTTQPCVAHSVRDFQNLCLRASGFTPSGHTTYRDLYNATPSPAGISSAEPKAQRPQTRVSPGCIEDISPDDGEETDGDYLYNIRAEELPQAPIYDIRLQDALRNVRGQLADLAHCMGQREQARDITTVFHNLYEQTLAASRFTYPATRMATRECVILSLIYRDGDGAACTTVVTEFRSVDDEHPHNYTVEADFMDNAEIRGLLEELLSAGAARRAWDTLLSLFPNQPELDLDFVSQEGEHAVEPIITRLEEWAMAGQESRPGGRESLQYSVVANHADECMELDDLVADSTDGLLLYLRSPVLRTGLILADLPGLIYACSGFRDLNYARARATERYLRHSCNEAFIVSTIFRRITDRSIGDIIRRCAQGQPIRIICTRSEDLDCRIEALKKRIGQVRTSRQQAVGSRSWNLSAEQNNPRLKRFFVSRRNRRVTESLSRAWGSQTRVFCVSNDLYTDHRAMDTEQASAYPELSGIKELCRYSESFLRNQLSALLGSLTLWASASADTATVSRAETLRGILDEADQTLKRTLTSRQSLIRLAQGSLEQQFTDLTKREIRNSRNDWKHDAVAASRDWATWHHSTYAAWCRNYGTYQTAKTVSRWDSMLDLLEDKKDGLDEEVSSLFQGLCVSIEEHNDLAPDTLRSLTLNMTTRQRCIIRAIHDSFDDLICATDSYIADVMRTVYNSCREQYGAGSDSRRKQTMNRHLTSPPFERTLNHLDQKLRDEIANITQDLRASVTVERDESEAGRDSKHAEELKQKVEILQGILAHACRIVGDVGQVTADSD
ncbi:hypothetical protein BDW75DRAFT_233955 [Aspergillus navahoensis]